VRFAGAVIFALAVATTGGPVLAAPPAGELLDRSQDRILERADIIARGRKHGEVRLIERGSVRVVQTLLYSKVLRRVLSRIRERERVNWPADREGHEASARYVAALERAERSVPAAPGGHPGAADERRRPLLIEFAVSNSGEGVALLEPELKEVDGRLVVEGARLIEALELPRDFVEQNMRLIAEENLSVKPDELLRMLAPPGAAGDEGARTEGAGGVTP